MGIHRSTQQVVVTLIALAIFMAGCTKGIKTSAPITIEVARFQKVDCGIPPQVTPLTLTEIPPSIIEDKDGIKWVALNPYHYQALSLNISAMKGLIVQKQKIVEFYQSCINKFNERADGKNSQIK